MRVVLPSLPRRSFLTAVVLGAVVGALFLGAGGRIAMRIVAVLDGRVPGWSVGGTLTVVFLGAAWGTAGGALLWLGRRSFRTRPMARGLLFWIPLTALYLRGLSPLGSDSLLAFTPFSLAYGAVLYAVWCRWFVRRWAAAPTPVSA